MAFQEQVYKSRRIVLVRLVRAESGRTRWDAPEVDARGWLHDPASRHTPAEVHGPVVGLPQTAEVRVKLERVRIDDAALLFLESEDPALVEVTQPTNGTALAADGIIKLKGGTGRFSDRFVKVNVRYGTQTGPVIFEFGVRVFAVIRPRVQPWIVSIRGRTGGPAFSTVAPTTNAARITRLGRTANRIWRPAGVNFNFRPARTFTITLDRAGEISYHSGDPTPPATVPAPGTTINGTTVAVGNHSEFWALRSTASGGRHTASHINVYWVTQFRNAALPANPFLLNAMTWARDLDASTHGIVMRDAADGNDLAHELGHFLSLPHSDMDDHSLHDVQVLKHLMYSFRPYTVNRGWRRNVGYGNRQRGALITMRNKPQYTRDGEWHESRTRARNPF